MGPVYRACRVSREQGGSASADVRRNPEGERYAECRTCRDLDQMTPGRARCARRAGNMWRARRSVSGDPGCQQATGGHEGAREMQKPTPFVPSLQPGVVPGLEPI